MVWIKECEEVFENLKKKLVTLPTLCPPRPGQPLILYVVRLDSLVNVVLVVEKEGENPTKSPIYYLSMALQGAEHKYPLIEKLVLAVVTVVR